MVSYDHFRFELKRQLQRAGASGSADVVIVSAAEFCRSLPKKGINVDYCYQAMRDEMTPDDTIVHDNNSVEGLVVRYRLPREI